MSQNTHIPYEWLGCTFWRIPETGNFEVYGFPLTEYTFRLWYLEEFGVWMLDAWHPDNEHMSISAHKLYMDWTFLELAALTVICSRDKFDLSILHAAGHPDLKNIMSHAISLAQTPPEWLGSIELKNSSADF